MGLCDLKKIIKHTKISWRFAEYKRISDPKEHLDPDFKKPL